MLQRVCDRCGSPVSQKDGDMNALDVIVGSDEFLVSYEDLCENCMSEFRTLINQYRRKADIAENKAPSKPKRASKKRWDRLQDTSTKEEPQAEKDSVTDAGPDKEADEDKEQATAE